MTTHELAKRLLSGPDIQVVTRNPGDAFFSVNDIVPIKLHDSHHGVDNYLFYEYNPKWHKETQLINGLELR